MSELSPVECVDADTIEQKLEAHSAVLARLAFERAQIAAGLDPTHLDCDTILRTTD